MKKKLLFGITSLTLGGAERVLVDLANALCDKYDITIFTIYSKGELEKQLAEKIKLKSLCKNSYVELSKTKKNIMPIKVLLLKNQIYKRYIKEDYDIEIAFLEGPITRLFSVKNKKSRKIAWIHNDITKVFGNGLKSKLKKILDRKVYSKYETLVFVSEDNLKKFNEEYKEIRNEYLEPIKKEVIYNYIDKEIIIKKADEKVNIEFNKNMINFVTVARLVEQKGIDRLIKVHSKLIKEGMEHNFYVIGDGPERQKLQKIIKENNVEKTFKLCGRKENPYPYIQKADYFCLLSRFEGYGMVLEEAKILNKSIIITDTAAREAVENYPNAKIVSNNEQGIYEILEKILTQKEQEQIVETKYKNEQILKQVKTLIEG